MQATERWRSGASVQILNQSSKQRCGLENRPAASVSPAGARSTNERGDATADQEETAGLGPRLKGRLKVPSPSTYWSSIAAKPRSVRQSMKLPQCRSEL